MLLAVERAVMMPHTAMECDLCYLSLVGGGMPAVPLRCGHTFHKVCLEECRKARVIDSVQVVKCPTCGLTDSDMAEKKPVLATLVLRVCQRF